MMYTQVKLKCDWKSKDGDLCHREQLIDVQVRLYSYDMAVSTYEVNMLAERAGWVRTSAYQNTIFCPKHKGVNNANQ